MKTPKSLQTLAVRMDAALEATCYRKCGVWLWGWRILHKGYRNVLECEPLLPVREEDGSKWMIVRPGNEPIFVKSLRNLDKSL